LILTIVTSHHDGWKINTLNTQHKPKLNIIKMEDLYNTHDCRAKHNYPHTNPNPKGISRYSI
jgi:hypothetical protein